MEKTRDTAERFALCALAATRRAKENERLVFHGGTFFYKTNSMIWAIVVPYSLVIPSYVEGSRCATSKLSPISDLPRRDRIDIHSSSRPIEAHVPIDQRKNGIVAPNPAVFPRQNFFPRLPHIMFPGNDKLPPDFFKP